MIRESAQRLSEKIMLEQQPEARWRSILIASRFKALPTPIPRFRARKGIVRRA
ncbi:hypothetical protein [Bradyrhizobium symbiodeficiens]|uniref:Uncharacterized protein n=1 Tax=Bradyrhizobium symbiodeficiens TaxID=1404367 RepID=A0A6G9A3R6_9BRAD|nr:hypothetical protein [Bradyrhizobium symbiodeficiens]QIP07058.1 hypothetical protein HAV00_12655 [Bradyrhizobium symbiodeficiens]